MKTTTTLPAGTPPASAETQPLRSARAHALTDQDLVARHRGVAEELEGSVHRGEITAEQARKFLLRIDAGLCREQERRRAAGSVPWAHR